MISTLNKFISCLRFIQDLLDNNKAIDVARSTADFAFPISALGLDKEWCILVYHDASWGNANSENDKLGEVAQKTKVHSQAGYLVYLVECQVLHGLQAVAVLVDWRSHGLKRVTRSTFDAEAMTNLLENIHCYAGAAAA